MRILLWHGYLLGGTGSNVYTRQLAREWSRAGHDVTVLSQEPRPEAVDIGAAAAVRPDVGGFLPVFVLDRYEGYEVRRVQDCTRAELDGWVVMLRWSAGPADSVMVSELTPVIPAAENPSVRAPMVPLMERLVKVATPLALVLTLVVPPRVPPPVAMLAVTDTPD